MSPTSRSPRHCIFKGSPNILGREPPGKTNLTTMSSSSSPYYQVSHEENKRQQLTCVHCGYQSQQAPDQTVVKKATDMPKGNTLIRPDGEKKACVRPAPDYDALDIANKIGII
ncbi:unnamed protein product [Gulo gulo]|uniref:Uncharacterized protein n=1 Tax=Gulo gulo TaxID=48420 RepID=A0A9X9LZ33_GULGU|nr:unnamed protein product [Gulo gulo]